LQNLKKDYTLFTQAERSLLVEFLLVETRLPEVLHPYIVACYLHCRCLHKRISLQRHILFRDISLDTFSLKIYLWRDIFSWEKYLKRHVLSGAGSDPRIFHMIPGNCRPGRVTLNRWIAASIYTKRSEIKILIYIVLTTLRLL
jgi:hypothetical protein